MYYSFFSVPSLISGPSVSKGFFYGLRLTQKGLNSLKGLKGSGMYYSFFSVPSLISGTSVSKGFFYGLRLKGSSRGHVHMLIIRIGRLGKYLTHQC